MMELEERVAAAIMDADDDAPYPWHDAPRSYRSAAIKQARAAIAEMRAWEKEQAQKLPWGAPIPNHEGTATLIQPCPPHEWGHAPTVGYYLCGKCNERVEHNDPRYAEIEAEIAAFVAAVSEQASAEVKG